MAAIPSPGPTNSILGPVQILQANEGGFLVISNVDSWGDFWGLALGLGPSGDLQWSKGYGSTTCIFRAAQTRDHGYVLSGWWEGEEHLLLMRLDQDGNLGANCSYVHQVALRSAPPVLHSSRTSLARRPVSFLSIDLPYLASASSCQVETLCLQAMQLPNPRLLERRHVADIELRFRR